MHSMSDSSLLFNQAIKNINKNGDKRIKKTPNICGKSPNVETFHGKGRIFLFINNHQSCNRELPRTTLHLYNNT